MNDDYIFNKTLVESVLGIKILSIWYNKWRMQFKER